MFQAERQSSTPIAVVRTIHFEVGLESEKDGRDSKASHLTSYCGQKTLLYHRTTSAWPLCGDLVWHSPNMMVTIFKIYSTKKSGSMYSINNIDVLLLFYSNLYGPWPSYYTRTHTRNIHNITKVNVLTLNSWLLWCKNSIPYDTIPYGKNTVSYNCLNYRMVLYG